MLDVCACAQLTQGYELMPVGLGRGPAHPPPPPEAQFLQLPSRQTGDIDKIRRFQNGQKPRDCTSLTTNRVSVTL